MWSDWIRALRDKDLLYKKGLLLVDKLEEGTKAAFEGAWKTVIQVRNFVFWVLVGAVAITVIAGGLWILFRLIGIEAAGYYQMLIIPVGLAWAVFLICIAILLGTFEGIIKQFPRIRERLAEIKLSILSWLKLPAWVGLVTLFLAVLVGRFPDLGKPQSFLSLLGIIAAFGLASFLGLCSVNLSWLKRFVQIQLFIALVLLLLAPQFPNVTAWLERKSSEGSTVWGLKANPKRVMIDPDSPPEFFVVGKPRFWFSLRSEGEFALWDTKGFDPDTNEELKPVATKERRDEILSSLRAKSAEKKRKEAELLEQERAAAAKTAADQAAAKIAADQAATKNAADQADAERKAVEQRLRDQAAQAEAAQKFALEKRRAQQEQMRKQEELIKAGKCPALVVRTFRTTTGWNLVLKNSSNKPLQIKTLTKHIAGTSEQTPFLLAIRSGAEETFGLPYAFTTGDALELICDNFEQPYTFVFP